MNQEKTNKVRELMREAMPQEDGDTGKQSVKIKGHNNSNIQVGHNSSVVLGSQAESGPEIMKCPACKFLVSKTADVCPRCSDNIALRRLLAYQKKQGETAIAVVVGFAIFASVYHWSGIWFGPEYAQWIASVSISPVAWWAIQNWTRPS